MKTKISLLIISLLAVSRFWAQEKYTTTYQVNYKVTYHLDTLHPDQTGSTNLYLYTGSNFGVFANYNVKTREEYMKKMKNKYGPDVSFDFSQSSSNPSFNRTFYKDLQTGEVITDAKLGKADYVFEEPKKFAPWQIQDSTKTFHNYAVQKATIRFAGRSYVAWFTMEIPIHDGPYLFSGLPGLIVELYDTQKDYRFKMKSLQKMDKPKNWSLPDEKKITKSKFKTLQREFHKNAKMNTDWNYIMTKTPHINGSISTNGQGKVTSSDLTMNGKKITVHEMRRLYKKNLESQNNPIERN